MTKEPESPEYRYKTALEQCDVEDREVLALYRGKRYEWLSWYELRQDEPNTVQAQIFNMLYLDLVYRTLVLPRKSGEHSKIAATSNTLAHFLDQAYVATQILAIRRLLDTRNDVFSLRRLLDDITKHRLLITREIYVCNDGLPYDPEAWRLLPDQGVEAKIFGIDAPQFAEFRRSRARHETFDHLSAVSPTLRKRCDRIKPSVFDTLRTWLASDTAEKLILLSHKFFAHASSTDSRGSIQYSGISLADVDAVQRTLVRVERAITDILLFIGISRDVVPMPPLGLLKGLDAPYTTNDLIQKMEEQWDQLVAERNQWTEGIVNDL